MTRRTLLSIDVRSLLGAADDLRSLDAERFGEVGLTAVNDVATRTEHRISDTIVSGINMSAAYVARRMGTRLGDNPLRPEAVIAAPAVDRPLGHFEPQQLTQAVKNPKRSKGDKRRGIAPGQKGAGVSVEVRRGNRLAVTNGFLMPLRGGNGWGVFTRERGSLRFQHRLGPAVYQLFRVQRDLLRDEVAVDLQLAVLAEADRVVGGVFAQ
jgi:hypothetical protein